MTSTNPKFEDVVKRLRFVLDLSSDLQFSERLGLKPSTWAMRKARHSLPTTEIDALLKSEQLSPEYVYYGTGDVHIPLEGESWEQTYAKRNNSIFSELAEWLLSKGHTKKDLHALATAAGSLPRYLHILRDLHLHMRIDLNWLIAASNSEESIYSRQEQDLINAYRKADKQGQDFIRRAAGMASK